MVALTPPIKQSWIVGEKGRRLASVVYPSAQITDAVCIYLHGYGASKDERGYLFSTIAKRMPMTTNVLFDYYGCGDSPGFLEDTTYHSMLSDARVVIEFVFRWRPKAKVFIIARGLSICIAAELSHIYPIRGLVFIGNGSKLGPPNVLVGHALTGMSLEFRRTFLSCDSETRGQISDWVSAMGTWVPNLMGEKLSPELILYSHAIRVNDLLADLSTPLLWLVTHPDHVISDGLACWYQIQGNDWSTSFHAPEAVDQAVLVIRNWVDNIANSETSFV